MAEGSIRKHTAKDGQTSWRWRIGLVDAGSGKRTWSQWTFRTRRELESFKAKKLAEVADGHAVSRSAKTVGALLGDWLTLEAPHAGLSVTSLENYQHAVRRYLLPGLGAIAVQKLTTEAIERHYAALLGQGYARSTIVLANVCLRQALDRAVRHKLAPHNAAAVRLRVLSVRNREAKARRTMHTWTREECAAFLEVAPQSVYGPFWALLLGTGMRRGEGLGVRWADLTLPEAPDRLGQARVAQSVEPLSGKPAVILPPKNQHTRLVPLVPALVAALHAHRPLVNARRTAAEPWRDQDLVFPRADGSVIAPGVVAYDLDRLIRIAGVPRLTPHELRHTFATLSLESGVPIHVVSRWLGHSSVAITMNVYAHVTQRLEERGAEVLISLFSGPHLRTSDQSVRVLCASCPFAPSEALSHQR